MDMSGPSLRSDLVEVTRVKTEAAVKACHLLDSPEGNET